MFDVASVIAGGFSLSPYGPQDQRGTLNEVSPERTASTLRLLSRGRPVTAYQLGEQIFNGFPAFPSVPPRLHDLFLYVLGYDAGLDFADGGGIQAGTMPIGPNQVIVHEERSTENYTFQIGTQLDGLNHVGIGTGDDRFGWLYNDTYAADIITPTGTTELGNETMGPIVTPAVIVDVVALKVAAGATADFFEGPNDQPILRDNYRITIDDIEACLDRQRVRQPLGPGDVPILHTGWTHLAAHRSPPIPRAGAGDLPRRGPLPRRPPSGHRRLGHVGAGGPRPGGDRRQCLPLPPGAARQDRHQDRRGLRHGRGDRRSLLRGRARRDASERSGCNRWLHAAGAPRPARPTATRLTSAVRSCGPAGGQGDAVQVAGQDHVVERLAALRRRTARGRCSGARSG